MRTFEEVKKHLESVYYNEEIDRYGIIGFLAGKGIVLDESTPITFVEPDRKTFYDFLQWFNSKNTKKEENIGDMKYVSEKLIEIFADSLDNPYFKFYESPEFNIKRERKNDTNRIELLYEISEKIEEIKRLVNDCQKSNTIGYNYLINALICDLKEIIDA